jgi:AcrR family transcriptional regulator
MASGNPGKRSRPGTKHPAGPDVGDAIRQFVVDRVTDTVNAKAARHSEKIEKLAPVARDVLELWTRQSPGARRPRFTRDEIAHAALHIADAEGFESLSMRRLAVELDAGTMTLYHYIRTKDELLALVMDAVMGELILDEDELVGGWRKALTAIAHRSRTVFERHPWVFDVHDDPAVGPNGVRHFDQSLQAVASLEISLAEKFDIIGAVDEYVFGHALQQRNNYPDFEEHSAAAEEMISYVIELTRTGDYPQISKLIGELGGRGMWDVISTSMRDTDRFDRTLQRLLDGIERDLPGCRDR